MAEASKTRELSGTWDHAVRMMMGGIALYYIWASTIGLVSLQYFRGIAILYSLVVPMLLYKGWKRARSDAPSVLDLLLAFAATGSVVYWMIAGRNAGAPLRLPPPLPAHSPPPQDSPPS